MYPYRVFVSYSRNDSDDVVKIVRRLEALGARPMWDEDLESGKRFHEEIRTRIAFAHLFMPVLTAASSDRPWVHQEIGYALALRIPVLPIALGALSTGLAEEIHALKLDPKLTDLDERLTVKVVEKLMQSQHDDSQAPFYCGQLAEERTRLLVEAARTVLELGGPSRLRHRSALSSFSLPDAPTTSRIWNDCEGNAVRGMEGRKWLREERRLMEQHARGAGCDLLIYPETITTRGRREQAARLRLLIQFLESMDDDKIRVAIGSGESPGGLHIVGDWFLAEVFAPRDRIGYLQTVFTRHAPTVLQRVEQFDEDFLQALGQPARQEAASRLGAIEKLKPLLEKAEKSERT